MSLWQSVNTLGQSRGNPDASQELVLLQAAEVCAGVPTYQDCNQ